jgi:hypothetical protein
MTFERAHDLQNGPSVRRIAAGLSLMLGACGEPEPAGPEWSEAFDAAGAGAMSSVWGAAPDDVWVVGGEPGRGTAFHFDGSTWTEEANLPEGSGLLVWAYGFGADDVWAVGTGGTIVRYDGTSWTSVESGTDEDLWGVFGFTPDDVWIVGGDPQTGDPLMYHWNGTELETGTLAEEQNPLGAKSLFKVWGIDGRLWAVGQGGTILELVDDVWTWVPAGEEANDDFVSLWGTSADNVVAVGGRSLSRIATFDGTSWTTTVPEGVPGLNAVYMDGQGTYIGGLQGWVGTFDGETHEEAPTTTHDIHAAWGDGAGTTYMVGGRFFDPYEGVALQRTLPEE